MDTCMDHERELQILFPKRVLREGGAEVAVASESTTASSPLATIQPSSAGSKCSHTAKLGCVLPLAIFPHVAGKLIMFFELSQGSFNLALLTPCLAQRINHLTGYAAYRSRGRANDTCND